MPPCDNLASPELWRSCGETAGRPWPRFKKPLARLKKLSLDIGCTVKEDIQARSEWCAATRRHRFSVVIEPALAPAAAGFLLPQSGSPSETSQLRPTNPRPAEPSPGLAGSAPLCRQ